MEKIDIHNFKQRFANAKKLLLACDSISKKEKQVILDFSDKCISENLSIARATKYVLYLRLLSRFFKKPFMKVTKKDIISLFSRASLGEIKARDGEKYAPSTIEDFKKTLRKFYGFIGKPGLVDKNVIKYSKISTNVQASDIWTEEEMQKLLNSATDIQTRAWLSLTTQLGNRIGEAGNLRIGDIETDAETNNVFVNLDGKTGKRTCVLLFPAEVLNWIDAHPLKHDSSAPMFVVTKNITRIENGKKIREPSIRQMSYTMFMKRLKTVYIKSGVKKPYNSHIFRHSVTVALLKKRYNSELIKKRMGWSPSSKVMSETYSHWTIGDLIDEEKRINGISQDGTVELKPAKVCPRCKTPHPNTEGGDFCKRCGSPISLNVALEMQDKKQSEFNELRELVLKNNQQTTDTFALIKTLLNPKETDRKEISEKLKTLGIDPAKVYYPKPYISHKTK